jgi:hypothetical protein
VAIFLGLTGFACMALGFFIGKFIGYKEGCADTIIMYEFLAGADRNLSQAVKNKKILDMFADEQ